MGALSGSVKGLETELHGHAARHRRAKHVPTPLGCCVFDNWRRGRSEEMGLNWASDARCSGRLRRAENHRKDNPKGVWGRVCSRDLIFSRSRSTSLLDRPWKRRERIMKPRARKKLTTQPSNFGVPCPQG